MLYSRKQRLNTRSERRVERSEVYGENLNAVETGRIP